MTGKHSKEIILNYIEYRYGLTVDSIAEYKDEFENYLREILGQSADIIISKINDFSEESGRGKKQNQEEQTAGKSKPGTATAVDANTWQFSKKVALPVQNMNNPHNMWTDRNQQYIYQTEWFDNKLDIFNRADGSFVSQITVGDSPAHVQTRSDTDDLHVSLNGANGIAEILAGTTSVNRIIPMQGADEDPTHPHAHWISHDGKKMVTPNAFTQDSTV